MISLHTSPLAQPGVGDSGGMNVYVRELAASLAQAGVRTTVYVRRDREDQPEVVAVEPFFDVVHVPVGPLGMAKEDLASVIDEFADWVGADIRRRGDVTTLHANYWLSAMAAHRLKHDLGLPLVTTFHTLAKVKASAGDHEPEARAQAEQMVIGCADAICASNRAEALQLVELCDADVDRIEIIPPGVDHAFFSPGDQAGARAALGLGDEPVLLCVGRIQPLKGLAVAVGALGALAESSAKLLVVGGPSGADGEAEFARIERMIDDLGLRDRVRFTDPQPHHMLSTFYRAADLCLVPSRSESFGLVAAEALACGTPVIASAVGGLTTLVEDGVTGRLLESRDPALWAEVIDGLLGAADVRSEMSIRAAAAGRQYSWSTTAARLRRVLADLSLAGAVEPCATA